MGNRKAISSDDFFGDYSHTAETKERLGQISAAGATQISSDMMFGANAQPGGSGGLGDAFQNNLMGRDSLNSKSTSDLTLTFVPSFVPRCWKLRRVQGSRVKGRRARRC